MYFQRFNILMMASLRRWMLVVCGRTAFAVRSDCVRRLIGLRSPPDDFFNDKVRKCSAFMGKSLYLCAIYVLCNQ